MKFRVEGLDIDIHIPENVKARKPKLGALIEWPCSCGFETLKIEKGDIASATGRSEGYRNLWPVIKDAAELTKQWNKIHREAKDFTDYFERLYAFKGERSQTWTRIREGGFTTTMRVGCPTCGRQYDFGVGVSNAEQPEPELTPLGAYRKFGIKNRKVERVLARWIAQNEAYKNPAEYIKYVLGLESSVDYVKALIANLKETIKENPPKSLNSEHWVTDLTESLGELEKDFEETTRKRLEKELQQIEDLIPKPKEYRLALIPTSAESLPPLSLKDLYG